MSWLRIEGRMPNHRKVSALSDAAFRLYVTASCWCVEEETDGLIPSHIPATLPRAPRGKSLTKAIAELVTAGVWDARDDGQHVVHDHLVYNPSAAESKAAREAKAAAGAAGGRAKANGLHGKNLAGASRLSKQPPSEPVAPATNPPEETPSKPLAEPKQNSSSRAGAGARSDSDPESDSDPQPPDPEQRQPPDTLVRCPMPVPVPDETLVGLNMSTGIPPAVARAFLAKWSVGQNSKVSELKTIDGWCAYAVGALNREWSGGKQAMITAAKESPDEVAERRRKRDEAERAAGEAKRKETAELAAQQRGAEPA